ncbi:MAG: acyl-CoA thioesterase [Spirochaetia bacterium]|nr:acyl-CoA thioesterase [Spirochaetia bacterium]
MINHEGMELITQHHVMSKDLNAHGNLFGGIMLAWIDESAAIYVMRKIGYTNIVTVNMDNVNFMTPGRNGDIIQIYGEIEKIGRSSIVIKTNSISLAMGSHNKRDVIQCKVTFVCLDELGRPFPFFEMNKDRKIS